MYLGLYKSICKEKNRITFPAKFKSQTGNRLILTNWFENSILILPTEVWKEQIHGIFEKNAFLLPDIRDFDRFIFGGTFEVELDQEGRFILPEYLKEYSNIEKEIIFVGGAYYIQLFDKETFDGIRDLGKIQLKEKAIRVFENIGKKQ